ncbi:MAG: hypothetical protein R2750_13345 [Bacteroidales bacterium]
MKPSPLIIAFMAWLAVFAIYPENSGATEFNRPNGGRSAGMAYSSVTLSDFWSIQNNQAGLANLTAFAAGINYENQFLVNEMSLKSGGFVAPSKFGVFGLNYQYFGYSQFSRSKIGLAYGKSFGEKISAGLQLDYLSTHIAEDYGNKSNVTFELGVRAVLSENLVLAAHTFNPINAKLEDQFGERISAIYKLGLMYTITDDFLIMAEAEKAMNFKPLIRGGIEYIIIEQLSARVGYSTLPSSSGSDDFSIASLYTFGFGLKLGSLDIDFAASVHQVLGWSPVVSLVYKFGSND